MRTAGLPLTLALCVSTATAPLLSAQAFPVAAPEDVGMSSDRLARLGQILQGYVEDQRLPGAVAMVLRGGRVVRIDAVGWRDLEGRAPMRENTIFRIASQTKAIVSVGILALQEEGKLLISDPVSKYLPEFADHRVAERRPDGGFDVVEADRAITLRDLLTHTAGIGYGYGPAATAWEEAEIQGWYFAHFDEPIRETVRRMAGLPFDAQPGEAYVYGYNTDILGAVLEVVSGQPLDVFLEERVFVPLGMDDTSFYLPPEKQGRLAIVYNQDGDRRVVRAPDGPGMRTQGQYLVGPRRSFSGGAGLLSTAHDYARFLQMMLNGGELDGHRVLSPKSVELMTSNHAGTLFSSLRPGLGFGLGFEVRMVLGEAGEPGSWGDYGWGGAYHSTYWVDPVEDLVVVYFTQVIPAAGLDDHAKLRAIVYGAILESKAGA